MPASSASKWPDPIWPSTNPTCSRFAGVIICASWSGSTEPRNLFSSMMLLLPGLPLMATATDVSIKSRPGFGVTVARKASARSRHLACSGVLGSIETSGISLLAETHASPSASG